jgi:Flp pilus assembly protein CpaB
VRRSSRIILLLGIVLAVVAFAATVTFINQRPPTTTTPTTLPTVYAREDIPLGTEIKENMVEVRPLEISVRPTDAIGDTGLVIGRTVRTDVSSGQLITEAVFSGGAAEAADVARLLGPGLRAIAVTVDQTAGVGSLITVGDRVDVVIAITGLDKFPLVVVDPTTGALAQLGFYNPTSSKVLLQGLQVVGTLVPAPPEGTTSATLTNQQIMVILAVTAQDAEVIKFAQLEGSISLVLRSPNDFRSGLEPVTPSPDLTTGIVLRTLIERYGVLPPEVIQATNVPTPLPTGSPLASPAPTPAPSPAVPASPAPAQSPGGSPEPSPSPSP